MWDSSPAMYPSAAASAFAQKSWQSWHWTGITHLWQKTSSQVWHLDQLRVLVPHWVQCRLGRDPWRARLPEAPDVT